MNHAKQRRKTLRAERFLNHLPETKADSTAAESPVTTSGREWDSEKIEKGDEKKKRPE